MFCAVLANTVGALEASVVCAHLAGDFSGVWLLLALLAGLVASGVSLADLTVLSVNARILQRCVFEGIFAGRFGARLAFVANANRYLACSSCASFTDQWLVFRFLSCAD